MTAAQHDLRSRPVRVEGSRRWVVTALLFTFMLINFADKAALGLAAKPLSRDFGLDAEAFGHVASSFYLLFSIAAILVGFLADRVPTQWVLLGMALVWSVAQLPLLWTVSVSLLVGSRVVLGAAEGPAYGTANHALHKWFPDAERQTPTSIVALGASVGSLLAAPGLTAVIVSFGWRAAFGLLAAIGLVWAVLWLWLGRDGREQTTASGADERASTDSAIVEQRVAYWRLFVNGTWVGSTLLGFAAYFGLALTVTWLPLFLEDGRGFSASQAGVAVAVFWTVGGLMTLGVGVWSERLTRRGLAPRRSRGMLAVLMVGGGGLLVAAGVSVNSPVLSLLLLVVGLGAPGTVFALGQTLAGGLCPTGQRGAVLGVSVGVSTLAGVLAPSVMGSLVGSASTALDGYDAGFLVLAALCVVCSVIGALAIDPDRDLLRIHGRGADAVEGVR
ncbi:MFS transporter [Marmoricola endophyticus]|uniref:MFS transporter n=1 Tax=Marmoricola endophyticus TaxID=2040280 RepID=A0A917BBU9_9ACTN|nr:MFS transporter [Marmoricola endophyticus]GGF36476.1 MFS transporter [Marmoricola endophyticus]